MPQRLLEGVDSDLLCPTQPKVGPRCWAVPECYRGSACSPLPVAWALGDSLLLFCYSVSSGG